MPYPTGTVTITDENSNTVATATLPGTGDTIFIPITNAPVGVHTYSAAYSGNSVYPAITAANFGSTYSVTVNPGKPYGDQRRAYWRAGNHQLWDAIYGDRHACRFRYTDGFHLISGKWRRLCDCSNHEQRSVQHIQSSIRHLRRHSCI